MKIYLMSLVCLLGTLLLTASTAQAQLQPSTFISAPTNELTTTTWVTATLNNPPSNYSLEWEADPYDITLSPFNGNLTIQVKAARVPSIDYVSHLACTVTNLSTNTTNVYYYAFTLQAAPGQQTGDGGVVLTPQAHTTVQEGGGVTMFCNNPIIVAESGPLGFPEKAVVAMCLPAQYSTTWTSDAAITITRLSGDDGCYVRSNNNTSQTVSANVYCQVKDLSDNSTTNLSYTYQVSPTGLGLTRNDQGVAALQGDKEAIKGLALSPNPASNFVQVQLLDNQGKAMEYNNALIHVLDAQGQVVISTNNPQINTSELAAGMYIVQVATQEKVVSQKLVVQ